MTDDRMKAQSRTVIQGFEDLDVFKKAYTTSLEIHRESLKFPREEQMNGIADQMRRASKGICANIAEGFGKQSVSTAEFKRYLLMAMGSADEMRVWVRYSVDLGYIDPARGSRWQADYQMIAKMLNRLHKVWG